MEQDGVALLSWAEAGDSLLWVVGPHQPGILLLTPTREPVIQQKRDPKKATDIPRSWPDNSTA